MDIYQDKICPICESELVHAKTYSIDYFQCTNKCYMMSNTVFANRITIHIYDYTYHISEHNPTIRHAREKAAVEQEIKQEIDYWKENDRYLTKILEES